MRAKKRINNRARKIGKIKRLKDWELTAALDNLTGMSDILGKAKYPNVQKSIQISRTLLEIELLSR